MKARDRVLVQAISGLTPNAFGWVRINCPLCPDKAGKADRKRSMGINIVTRKYKCFRCGGGRITAELDEFVGFKPEAKPEIREAVEPPESYMLLSEEPAVSSLMCRAPRNYLRTRSFDEALWREVQIGVCLQGRYAGRIIMPLLIDQEWMGWVGRVWTKGHERPYIYPPGMPRGEFLYNQAALQVETDEPVLVVEGVMDALAYWPQAVAVLGKPSHLQVEALQDAKRPVVAVLDGDAANEGEALSMHLRLEGARAGSITLPPCKDPDELDKDRMRLRARESIDAFEAVTY